MDEECYMIKGDGWNEGRVNKMFNNKKNINIINESEAGRVGVEMQMIFQK